MGLSLGFRVWGLGCFRFGGSGLKRLGVRDSGFEIEVFTGAHHGFCDPLGPLFSTPNPKLLNPKP